ncbi:MAG TPA: DNA-binding protein WhiA [Candidatus Ozemobacteraceae bacterium]|nr:DNA-binding protein WhiA [Candidatus Ozemobacteraceae bacterium]
MSRRYHLALKRDLLSAPPAMPCCGEALLAGLARRRGSTMAVRGPRQLRRSLFRGVEAACPPGVSLDRTGRELRIGGIDPTALRRNVAGRIRIQAAGKSGGHCARAFVRGLFIRAGYMQDPEQGYHLELVLPGKWAFRLLRLCSVSLRVPFRFCRRRGRIVAYLKGARRLVRLLKAFESFDRALRLEDLIATRQLLGTVNRQVNFETANINKQVSASERLREQIGRLLEHADQEIWTDALRELALMRIRYPIDSIEALGKRCIPPLSKSAVNHRLRRIAALYREIFEPAKGGVARE